MANRSAMAWIAILLIVIFSTAFIRSQARIIHHGDKLMHNNLGSKELLVELGFDVSKVEGAQRPRSLAQYDQVVPGGPDHQHHS